MTRTQFQPGAADDHYHDTLGVDETVPGQQTLRLLGPTRLAFDTPDFVEPETTNGPVVRTISAGSLFLVIPMAAIAWDEGVSVEVSVSAAGDLNSIAGGVFDGGAAAAAFGTQGLVGLSTAQETSAKGARWVYAFADCDVAVAAWPSGVTPTAGAVDIYILVAEPTQ